VNTFRHAGDRGDIVAGLPTLRALGGGVLFIEAATYTREMLTPDRWCGLDTLIKQQPYISDVREWQRTQTTFNGNDWRVRHGRAMRTGQFKDRPLTDWQLDQYGLPFTERDTPWLTVEPRKEARVIFNRTGAGRTIHNTYHNRRFPWHFVWEKYRKQAAFVGTPDEHSVFCATCGKVPHIPTKDLNEAAQVIAGCDLFVGNQSVCFWLAEGMKKNLVLEVWPEGPNSTIVRPGATQGHDEKVQLPDL
jgi:hypothetical protein